MIVSRSLISDLVYGESGLYRVSEWFSSVSGWVD